MSVREPPDLAKDAVVAALQAGYGIPVAALVLVPVGNDADSWAQDIAAYAEQAMLAPGLARPPGGPRWRASWTCSRRATSSTRRGSRTPASAPAQLAATAPPRSASM
jgi:hypothetical protein